jgi:hypothetical protein
VRLVYVHPTSGELYYLRMLLGHQKGCTSFEGIRTVSRAVYPTYRACCESLGLLGDDKEWSTGFAEASAWATSTELRLLFTHMLIFCEVSNPSKLWEEHWQKMSDDIVRDIHRRTNVPSHCIPARDLQEQILFQIEKLLNSSIPSRTLKDFGLPLPSEEHLNILQNRLLMEERCYDTEMLSRESERLRSGLNAVQLEAYNLVMSSFTNNKQLLLFIYGHGGTCKTYLWNTIISTIRSLGKIVLAVAASGIASLLLPSGRTAHSRFKIPIEITNDSICDIKKNTKLGNLLMETDLIIWDEAPMNDKRCFENLDKSLRDLHNRNHLPFGGKSVLLGGDFRQTLPVKPKGCKSTIISSSLPTSYLWQSFQLLKLTQNMRLQKPGLTEDEKLKIATFYNGY